MKILLVEDSNDNIESAKLQLEGHELRVRMGLEDVEQKDFEWADVVLTDLYLPRGYSKLNRLRGPSLEKVPLSTLLPGGFLIVLAALAVKTPVALLTDSNGHNDVLSMLMGVYMPRNPFSLPWDEEKDPDMKGKYDAFVESDSPNWVQLPGGRKGKDWLKPMKRLISKKEFQQGFVDFPNSGSSTP